MKQVIGKMGIFDLFQQIESGSAGRVHGKLTWIVAGLGNPGLEYEHTRHNAGFLAVEELAKQCGGVKLNQMKFQSNCCEAMLGEVRCLLMQPTTYMNLSGDAIAAAANFYKIPPEQVLVIYDDISLPPGKLRLRRKKELEKEKEKISANMEYIRREIRELDEKRERIMQQQDGMNIGTRERSTEDLLELRIDRVKRRRELTDAVLTVVLLGGIAGTGCLAAFSGQVIFSVLAGVATAAISVAALFFRIRLSRELNKRERQRERWLSRHEELTWNRNSLDSDYEEKHTALENLQAELTECEENTEVITPEETEIQALNMAMETIEALSGNITDQVGIRLKKRTSEILSEITGGRYQEVLMDEALHMSVNTGERIVSIERLSRGTLEQIYFALRMAAGELFCKEEPFPVILDDVFGMYDEERLAAALRWLHKENRQVIISTCHKREMEILDKERIPYQKLPM